MTLAMIQAVLGLLIAFNVGSTTVANVEAILMPKVVTVQQTVPQNEPSVNLGQASPQPAPIGPTEIRATVSKISSQDNGVFNIVVSVLREGQSQQNAQVHIEGEDNTYPSDLSNPNTNRKTNRQTASGWETDFDYIPTSKGQKTVIITSGELTKSVTVDVE